MDRKSTTLDKSGPLDQLGSHVLQQTDQGALMVYVDGFVLPVPKRNKQAYLRVARKMGKICRGYGALEYRECIADDVKPGKHTAFAHI